MKTILTSFLIVLCSLFCEAKPTKNSLKTNDITFDDKIPDYVEKWLNDELANSTTIVLENFESPAFFTRKNAKIIGYINGYDQTQGAKTEMYYYINELTQESKPRVIEIHNDGRFELELPLEYPKQDFIKINNQFIPFYLEPGQNLSIILNWKDVKKPNNNSPQNVIYQGVLGKINTNLVHYSPTPKVNLFQQKQEIMEPKAYKSYMLQYKTDALNKISGYKQSGVIDKKVSELLENEALLNTYYYLFDYYPITHSPRYGGGKIKVNNIDDTVPDDYYDFIKDLPLNKQSILVNKRFSSLVNRLEFATQLDVIGSITIKITDFISEDFLTYLEKNNLKISAEDKNFLQNSIKNKDKNLFKDNIKSVLNFTEKYKAILIKYKEVQYANAWQKEFIRVEKKKDSIAKKLNITNNLVYEIIQTRKLSFILKANFYKDKIWHWNELKKRIRSPHLLKVGNSFVNSQISKPKLYKLPKDNKGTTIFNKLIAPYKGKVVVVKFWDPRSYYRGEILEISKVKRNLFANNKDVVFLHIANRNRVSKRRYDESVLKNGFKNSVAIPQDDYHYLRHLFQFNRVHDLIVAKDGVTIYESDGVHHIKLELLSKFNIKPTE